MGGADNIDSIEVAGVLVRNMSDSRQVNDGVGCSCLSESPRDRRRYHHGLSKVTGDSDWFVAMLMQMRT